MGECGVLRGRPCSDSFSPVMYLRGITYSGGDVRNNQIAWMGEVSRSLPVRNCKGVQSSAQQFQCNGRLDTPNVCSSSPPSLQQNRSNWNQFPLNPSELQSAHSSFRCGVAARRLGCEQWRQRGRGRNGRRNLAADARSQKQEPGSTEWMERGDPYKVLGVTPDCTEEDIKAAFRSRVKEFHPDVYKGSEDADGITQRIIRAYEMLTNESVERLYRRENLDPFEYPECEAEDVFVFEMNCIGRGCPYPCVGRAPDVFKFAANTGCARAVSQRGPGQGEDYGVQLAVGQCPRNCIYWVTPMQRAVLEDLMERALEGTTYSSEVVTLEALITRANYENGRYQPPKQKRQPTGGDQWVDWF